MPSKIAQETSAMVNLNFNDNDKSIIKRICGFLFFSMKIFFSENNIDYKSYTFGYTIYCLKESSNELSDIYAKGFLPYTGNLAIKEEVFYLARSLRAELDKFQDTSENRRLARIVEPLGLKIVLIPKEDFDVTNPDFIVFCETYIKDRIGEGNMSLERWNYILSRATGTHIFQVSSELNDTSKTIAYVLVAIQDKTLHYWFAFFDTEYMHKYSIGKWIMWRIIHWAKEHDFNYVYLGTAYEKTALYKIRDFKGLAFFDGYGWNLDMDLLKKRCNSDTEPKTFDVFKTLDNPNTFLEIL